MNCIYCHSHTTKASPFTFWCKNCRTTYGVENDSISCIIMMSDSKVYVSLDIRSNQCKIFIDISELDPAIILGHLPFIHPSNIDEWTDKILNMKAFF